MPEYTYRCDDCGYQADYRYPMGSAPKALACSMCKRGAMHRVYHPTLDLWRNADGQLVRSPGRQWEGGDKFDPVEFAAKNRVDTGRGRKVQP